MDVGLSIFIEDDSPDDGCCLREPGHPGSCAWGCSDCNGTGRCWACNGYNPGDDLGSGCTECDGWGTCAYCGGDGYEEG